LGWNFRKYRRQLLIKPSKKSIHRIIKQINDVIRKGKTWTQELLIDKLNPVITGWSNYHQVAVAKRIFYNIDHIIWEMLWQWARRRHPNKSHKWIASRYWHTKGNNRWLFATESNQLKSMSDRKIIRTSPIKKDMNPYLNKDYWLEYKFKEGNKRLTGMYKKIWERQKGICPDCNQLININSDAESRPLHHIDGNHSNYKITNLVYKHAHCHRQGHALNSKITA
jgi:RNA-directed DNA polymerase